VVTWCDPMVHPQGVALTGRSRRTLASLRLLSEAFGGTYPDTGSKLVSITRSDAWQENTSAAIVTILPDQACPIYSNDSIKPIGLNIAP
jgi:hypothetical protein